MRSGAYTNRVDSWNCDLSSMSRHPAYNTFDGFRRMTENTNSESFEEIVEWAFNTLPQKIRELPDFPGIQVADEPPDDVLKKRNWPRGREMLGVFSGVYRTQRRFNQLRSAPDLIFVFRGPIQRCSRGDLRAEVKEVVWHEVAHWLGHDEEEVRDLGLANLSLPSEDATNQHPESAIHKAKVEAAKAALRPRLPETLNGAAESEEQQLRCLKCYSQDVTCRELQKPMTYLGASLINPLLVHTKMCTCQSCGYEWDDEDNA
jgi:predicted Zn-dependent protease with MMP-like domain